MIKLIVGNKGSGKTKTLVDLINKSARQTDGNLVCVEKGQKLMYEIDHSVRLVNTDDYSLAGYDAFYGFIAGLLAANYDLKEIFVDSILKIGGGNPVSYTHLFFRRKAKGKKTNAFPIRLLY